MITKYWNQILNHFFLKGVVRNIDKKNNLHPDVYIGLTLLFMIPISVSPLIYGIMNNSIREQCIILIPCIKKTVQNDAIIRKEINMISLRIKDPDLGLGFNKKKRNIITI